MWSRQFIDDKCNRMYVEQLAFAMRSRADDKYNEKNPPDYDDDNKTPNLLTQHLPLTQTTLNDVLTKLQSILQSAIPGYLYEYILFRLILLCDISNFLFSSIQNISLWNILKPTQISKIIQQHLSRNPVYNTETGIVHVTIKENDGITILTHEWELNYLAFQQFLPIQLYLQIKNLQYIEQINIIHQYILDYSASSKNIQFSAFLIYFVDMIEQVPLDTINLSDIKKNITTYTIKSLNELELTNTQLIQIWDIFTKDQLEYMLQKCNNI